MKILVTGAAGFIGSHLAERLLKEGYTVVGVDSFLAYYPRRIKEHNVKGLNGKKGFEFVEGDILELNLDKLLGGIDAVFHQAAIAGVRSSWGAGFDEYVRNNILGTQLLLEACRDRQLKKFVYASSSSVYGDSDELPIKETSPVRPVSPYGVTKLSGEQLAYLYFKGYGVPVVSLRYFTVYGPRQRPDMAFHKFLKAVILGGEIEVYGTGEQTRDFVYVRDIVEANMLALDSKKAAGEAINVGSGTRVSVNRVAEVLKSLLNKTSVKNMYVDPRVGDVLHGCAAITKAGEILGYRPTVSFEEGLRELVEWYNE